MAGAGAIQFARTIGTDRVFSSASQDCSNKYATAELLYGVAQANSIPDLERTELLLVIGSNPRVSKSSFLSVAGSGAARCSAIRDRGGRVVFVNPLVIEPGIGETLQLRPDTDPYLLAAMLHEIERTRGFRLGALDGEVDNVDAVREFIAPYSPEVVAPIVGLPAEQIVELAHAFADADGASIHVSTGLNMGRQGSLAYWLTQMLLVLTGNLDRPGGNYFAARGVPDRTGTRRSHRGVVRADQVGPVPADGGHDAGRAPGRPDRPTTTNRMRALVVIAGNPALSVGGSGRMHEALASLELLVTIDLYRNATGELADFVLPATDQFEREDLNTFVQGVQSEPFVQWTGAVTEPDAEQREEWRVLSELLGHLGYPVALDPSWTDPLPLVYDGALAAHDLSVERPARRRRRACSPSRGPVAASASSASLHRSTACPTACAARSSAGTTCSATSRRSPTVSSS